MMLSGAKLRVFDDKTAVAEAAAALTLAQARAAIAERGRFRIVLAGGTTPTAAYRLLAGSQSDWSAWHVYHGDERCLPPGDSERNSLAADQAFLAQVPIPRGQIYPIAAELGAVTAAAAYTDIVANALPFDLVLLGMGEDGHTASLFPGREIPPEPFVIPVHDAPKAPSDRVSLTPRALCRSNRIVLLITGAGKRDALRRWALGETLPVQSVAACGNSIALLDRAAADGLNLETAVDR
ncbi:MAG: 6-phosphogluconolactonase [Thiohalocapsa sp.]